LARAPFQILVFPFRKKSEGGYEFAVFRRADTGYWQAIAGGGEDEETPREAARREAWEEAEIPPSFVFSQLQSVDSVPRNVFDGSNDHWPEELYVIPQYTFAVNCDGHAIQLSAEHTEFKWGSFEEVEACLYWSSNKVALWELNERLRKGDLL